MTSSQRREMVRGLDRTFEAETGYSRDDWGELMEALSPGGDDGSYNEHEFDPYDVANLFSGHVGIHLKQKGRQAKPEMSRPSVSLPALGGSVQPVIYEGAASFRYALPE